MEVTRNTTISITTTTTTTTTAFSNTTDHRIGMCYAIDVCSASVISVVRFEANFVIVKCRDNFCNCDQPH